MSNLPGRSTSDGRPVARAPARSDQETGAEQTMPVLAAERGTREALESIQARRLSALLAEILPLNRFYIRKLAEAGLEPEDLTSPVELQRLPFTTKDQLLAEQELRPPYGDVHTYPLDR